MFDNVPHERPERPAEVEALHTLACAQGRVSVWLDANIHNARANRCCEKSGFVMVRDEKCRIGATVHDDGVRGRSRQSAA